MDKVKTIKELDRVVDILSSMEDEMIFELEDDKHDLSHQAIGKALDWVSVLVDELEKNL